MKPKHLNLLLNLLEKHGITMHVHGQDLMFSKNKKNISIYVALEKELLPKQAKSIVIPEDKLIREPQKIVAIILSQLQLNEKIFARKCEIKQVDKQRATEFLERYHLMNATQSATCLGLFYKDEMLALATFSKGRKMNRLAAHQRSFELIRFCCKSGITVTGGLTRLVKKFCEEKKAGDVMTYVDKQLSDGRSFILAGFKMHSDMAPNYFIINKSTFERIPCKKEEIFDSNKFYMTQNSGSLKLVYTPLEQI